MKINLVYRGILFAFIALALFSCENRQASKQESLILNNSNSNINSYDPVVIMFKKPIELFKGLSQSERNSVIEVSPKVNGKVFQTEKNQLVFQPEKPFQFSKEYLITVHTDKLFNKPATKKEQLKIKINPLQISLYFDNFLPDKKSDNLYKLKGRIHTSDEIKIDELIKNITATINSKTLPVSIKKNDDGTSYTFEINDILRTENKQLLTVDIDKHLIGSQKNETFKYTIPAIDVFKLTNYEVNTSPENYITLNFSDYLDNDQNLNGLIYFRNGPGAKTMIKGNQILVYPNSDVVGSKELIISSNIKNNRGVNLDKQYTVKPVFKEINPQVRFLGKGNILPGADKWNIPFEAVNLQAVDVIVFKIYSNNIKQFLQNNNIGSEDWSLKRVGEYIHHEQIILNAGLTKPDNKWKSYAIDLSKMIQTDPGAIYRISFRFRKEYAALKCSNSNSNNETNDFDSTSYYYSDYYYPKNYQWGKKNNPCNVSYYNYNRFVSRNFLASNIGLTIKQSNDNEYHVFVRDIISTEAISDATIHFYSYQNQLLTKGRTNNQGEVVVTLDKKPFLVVARWNNQYAYLRLQGGSSLSYSKFNTDGTKTKAGLKGYIFGERGVWRPGDTLFLTFVLQDKEKALPDGHPVFMEIKNSRDKKVFSKTLTKSINNFYVFKIPTAQDAPTGIWKAKVEVGNHTFTKSLRVETILPNRLSIKMTTDGEGFVASKKGKIYIESKWLHGGIASGLKANITENIRTAKTIFEGYKNYIFDDPSKKFYPDEQVIFDDKLNQSGKAEVNVVLPERKGLPGTLNLNFVAKVFEPGGRFSIDMKSFKYTPYKQYVGLQIPDKGDSYYYETDKDQTFKIVTVDDNGNKISVNNLKVEVFKLGWSWWYSSNNSNLANYLNKNYEQKVFSKTINTKNGSGTFTFKTKYPNWGKYFVRVTDNNGGHSAGAVLYFDWPSSYSRGNRKAPGDAALLSLSSNQEQYQAGETATISFPSSSNAKALISIEKNNHIIKSWWIETSEDETSFTFEVTKEMAPNVYAFVSVIQPHEQTVNDLPIRSYGVLPVLINDPATVLKPILTTPEKIKPESVYTVNVKEAEGKKMTYVLAIVDEGLLNLTHFKTPSLHDYFYKKEALAVKTWDLYDEVNGAFGTKLSQVFAIGGDEEIKELGKNKINRFKPVVTFLGPFTLESGSKGKTHHIKMDNYIGSVRIMVMAGNNDAYGKAEKSVPVKQPLMVLASMPRLLAPGEELHLPVTVFAMEDYIKKVTLKVTSNEHFKIKKPTQTLSFENTGEQIAYVDLTVNDLSGTGKVHLEVTANGKKADYDVTIAVRNLNQRVYKTESFAISKGSSWKGKANYPSNSTDYEFTASISRIPSINLEKRIKYLIRYPYGCVEQTVSSVFPQLFLSKLTSLTNDQKIEIENNVQQAIKKLNSFQKASGGFSYWPNGEYISDWGTSYAGHFMILAKEAGYYIPTDLLNNWIRYQQTAANQWRINTSGKYSYDLEQAYRLYTLALAGRPSYSAMNRMRENTQISSRAKLRLAAAFAVINEKSTAIKLIEDASSNDDISNDHRRYNFGSYTRDLSLSLETYMLTGNKTEAFKLFKEIAGKMGSNGWMSTQTTAFALYAISLFTDNEEEQESYRFGYRYEDKNNSIESDKPVCYFNLNPNEEESLKVKNNSKQTLFLTLETSGIPKPGQAVNISKGLKLKVTYYDMKGEIIDPKSLKQGTDFYAKVEVNKTIKRQLTNLALDFIIPSGWEILNTRMVDVGKGLSSSGSDFEDIRDDRVNLFFSMNYVNRNTYYIMLNAAYPGRYYNPPISCKAMYDNSINATIGGGMVEVYQ